MVNFVFYLLYVYIYKNVMVIHEEVHTIITIIELSPINFNRKNTEASFVFFVCACRTASHICVYRMPSLICFLISFGL